MNLPQHHLGGSYLSQQTFILKEDWMVTETKTVLLTQALYPVVAAQYQSPPSLVSRIEKSTWDPTPLSIPQRLGAIDWSSPGGVTGVHVRER